MRILSMDVGDKRIGLAISDALGWTAQGIETLERRGIKYDLDKLQEIVKEHKPQHIVVGLPKNMNGSIGPQGEKVKEFAENIKSHLDLEIVYWDERLTTVSANKMMIEADVSRQKRKKKVDQIAAVLILQSYLDYINRK